MIYYIEDMVLSVKYQDHPLKGKWFDHRELHIKPDWLLIYRKDNQQLFLTLVATGSHADLFNM
ncbi:type II toxin-antitoxin system YafQ family toxin [Lentilactobacillus kisonensis]|nr:type II toxin-antitoxin system YafQ family toxin [Lentilactobacillus kisonensis]